MNGERVLVTGASGFVGRRTLEPLLQAGAEVHVTEYGDDRVDAAGVTRHALDLHDAAAVGAMMRRVRPQRLLHFAWMVTPGVYTTSLDNLRWVGSTLQLIESFVSHGGRRVVSAGTSSEYDWSSGLCDEATTPLRPSTLYAASKGGVYGIVERMAAQLGFEFAWGRLFFLYGPGEAPERLVPSMVHAAWNATPFALRHPQQVRDYMHVADAGSAFAALLGSGVQKAVNIASGDPIRLEEIAAAIGRACGRPLTIETPPGVGLDPAPRVVASVARLRMDVGWQPRYSLESGLGETVNWWRERARMVHA